jgi:hypothetical protein
VDHIVFFFYNKIADAGTQELRLRTRRERTMKRNISKFFSGRFGSEGSEVRTYEHDEGMINVLGHAKAIRGHAYTYFKTSNAVATIKFFESSLDGRPGKNGKLMTGGEITLTNENPKVFQVNGPFCNRVEALLEIDSNDSNPAEIQMDIGLTLILEE